jgi:diguanylate cyclase (GGDEF)-like protein/PAS domain S-box-containing protein
MIDVPALHAAIRRVPPLAIVLFLACALLIGLVWSLDSTRSASRHAQAEAAALRQAQELSRAYAEQLRRSVDELDQITLTLKYYWEHARGAVLLEDQARNGLYPKSAGLYVLIIDSNGDKVTGTLPGPLALADREYFRIHKDGRQVGLYISEPYIGRTTGSAVIAFSRALHKPDGSFDGVVMVAVEPGYIAAFYERASFGRQDFLAVHRADGAFLSGKAGGGLDGTVSSLMPAPPQADGPAGATAIDAGRFADGAGRVVAWQRLPGYPLTASVGLSSADIHAAAKDASRHAHQSAVGATALLTVAGLGGIFATLRAAGRARREARIQETYRLATDGAREGFFMIGSITGADGQVADFAVQDCNERGAAFVGFKRDALLGMRFTELYRGAALSRVMGIFRESMQSGFYEDEFMVRRDCGERPLWLHRKLVRSGDALAMTVRDISDAKAHAQALSRLASEDALTTLHNRHWLMQQMPQSVAAARAAGHMLALLFFDLDDFKNVNNTLGHAAGDDLLRLTALRLRSALRPGDHAVRLGGDEFTVILGQVDSPEQVAKVTERVIAALREPFVLSGGSRHTVHASIGISMFPADGDDADTLLKHADIAMYAVKASGKGQYHFYKPALSARLMQRLALEQALREAVDGDQFVLHYQPRVDTATGALRSMEALVRWQHPQRGLVGPMEFIEVAEAMGLIQALGQQVADKVCIQLRAWEAQGLRLVPVSINVSAEQFNHGDVPGMIAGCIARHGIPPALLEVELTESCMLVTDRPVADQLAVIKALGVKLLVDDFGTGYSSLSQLQQLDLDVLKVDRAFTAQLCRGHEGVAFFRAIVSMAHVLGMSVVAEGVETLEALQILADMGCDEVQGYYISRPLPATDAARLLRGGSLFPALQRSA